MTNSEKKPSERFDYPAFPLGKIPNEFLFANPSIDGEKLRTPVLDICKWNLEFNLKHERLFHHSRNNKRLHEALKLFDNLHELAPVGRTS